MKQLLVLIMGLLLAFSTAEAGTVKRYKSIVPDGERTLVLDGYVSGRSIDPLISKVKELNEKDDTRAIYLIITSGGGSIVAGNRLISAIEASKAPVVGVIDGYAYSMAAVIALYVDKLYMVENSDMMFHEARYCACGLEQHIVTRFKHNKKWVDGFNAQIAAKLKMPLGDYLKAQRSELWLTAADAVKRGIADGITKGVSYTIPEKPSLFFFFMEASHENRFIAVDKGDIFYGKPLNGETLVCPIN